MSERAEVANLIERFLDGTCGPHEWDDFLGVRSRDPVVERVRGIAAELPSTHPPASESEYCSEEGAGLLRELARELREQQDR